jgi:hypothetical protein
MSISKQVYTTAKVGKDVGGVAFSVNYDMAGSACLNGQQWFFDQYGRGPVSPDSIPDTCPGSVNNVVYRLASEQDARPEYFARLNAMGIIGYGNIDSVWDAQLGQQTQNRSYYLGLVKGQEASAGVTNPVQATQAAPYQTLGIPDVVSSFPSFGSIPKLS